MPRAGTKTLDSGEPFPALAIETVAHGRLSLPDSLRTPSSNPLTRLVQLPHRRRPEDRPGRRLETGGWFGRSAA